MKIKIGEVFNLEKKQVSVDVIVVGIADNRKSATIREIGSGEENTFPIGYYPGSQIEVIECKGDYDFNILYGQEISTNLKEKLINDFKETGTINSNLVIEASLDMYDFRDVVDEKDYSSSLKQLIEDNRPTV